MQFDSMCVHFEQVPRGYIRCDYLVVTHCIIVYDIGRFSTHKNLDFRRLKITRDGRTDGPTDGRTDGRTDTTSYRDA